MRQVEELKITYVGYDRPETLNELELEILGLELAIKCAEQRIALLKQSLKLTTMKAGDTANNE